MMLSISALLQARCLFLLISTSVAHSSVYMSSTLNVDFNQTTAYRLSETTTWWITNSTYSNGRLSNSTLKPGITVSNYELLPEYKAYMFFKTYFVYITSVPGLVTNPMCIYIALNIRPRTTAEIHMFALGVTDCLVVSLRLLLLLLRQTKHQWTNISCKLMFYTLNTSYVFSNWILVSWTVERFIAVMFPMKMNIWCSIRNVKRMLLIVLFVCCCLMIPQITEAQTISYGIGDTAICYYSAIYFSTFAMLENFFYMYIPMIIITGCNILIIYRIQQASKQRMLYTTKEETLRKRAKEQKQMTFVLLTVAGMFLILHIPQLIAKVWQAVYPNQLEILQYSVINYIRYVLFTTLGYFITDFQNSINFFLYCAFGSKVKCTLSRMFNCRKSSEDKNISHTESKTISTVM